MDRRLQSLKIVKMQEKHIEEISAIETLCFSVPWSYNALAEELSNPLAVFIAALDEQKKVLGYAGMHHIIDEGYIANIAVHPDFRRQGIATALLQRLDRYSHENGLALLTLEVRASNAAAIGLYRREGFNEQGIRRGFYQAPSEDAVIMTKYF